LCGPRWCGGLNPLDHQTKWLVEGARAGASITLFTDEIRCPTYISDLCAALLELAVKPEITGPMNLTGPQALNRWELGTRLLTALKIAPGPNIGPGTVAASGLIRSRNLTLVAQRAQALLRTRLRGVDEVLAKW
jgi:dTDP-4-dehydrorhamnose reductase